MKKWFDTLALSVIVFTLPNHRKMRNSMMKKVLLVLGLFLGLLVKEISTAPKYVAQALTSRPRNKTKTNRTFFTIEFLSSTVIGEGKAYDA